MARYVRDLYDRDHRIGDEATLAPPLTGSMRSGGGGGLGDDRRDRGRRGRAGGGRARAWRSSATSPGSTGSRIELVAVRPGRRALPQDRRGPARLGARRPPRVRRHLPRRRRPSRGAARRAREGHPAPAPVRLPPVRQPPPGPALPGRRDADQGQGPRRHRHGRRPREQRGPLRRRRRLHPQGDARGGRDPDLDQHPGRASSAASGSPSTWPGRRGKARPFRGPRRPTTATGAASARSRWSPRPTS